MKHLTRAFCLFNILLLAGCAGNLFPSAGNQPILIESEPGAAEVYVMGEKIGVTPYPLSRREVFPNSYPKDKESLYGKVTLKKEGCADFTRPVSTEIVSQGLHAKLDCGDKMPSAAPATPNATVEQRLEKIRELLGKGLISEEEAGKARARILDGL